jgi:hypothetical protein
VAPEFVARAPFTAEYKAQLFGLSKLLHEDNFSDVIAILSKAHFTRDVTCAVVYDWLVDIARENGDEALIARALETKRFFIGE